MEKELLERIFQKWVENNFYDDEKQNINIIKGEVDLLEGMISNLLLSDKLSIPYSNLELRKVNALKINYTTRVGDYTQNFN